MPTSFGALIVNAYELSKDLDIFCNADGRIYISINPARLKCTVDPLLSEYVNTLPLEEKDRDIWERFNALARLVSNRFGLPACSMS